MGQLENLISKAQVKSNFTDQSGISFCKEYK